jgi:YfiH family protein
VATRALSKTTSKPARLNVLRAGNLSKISWLIHGFSTRVGGSSRAYGGKSLNLGYTKDDAKTAVDRNRQAFLRGLGATERSKRGKSPSIWPLITTRQIHSDLIHFVDAETRETPSGDGLITATPGIALGIQTADCLPIILVDPKHRAVGVFHAGWRGTLKRIIEKGVGEMHRHFGTNAADIRAAIGPGIGNCCYEVGEEVRAKFESQFAYAETLFHEVKDSDPVREKYPLLFLTARAPGHSELPKKIFLDLVEANRQQLIAVGVRKRSIEASPLCTNCRTDLLFSYRAEKGKTGRMMAVVGIRG